MNRRDLLISLPALATATRLAPSAHAAAGRGRLRSAICCYSYRNELDPKKGKMTYQDVISTAVELGIDGVDMTVYWFPPDAGDDFLLPLKSFAFKNGVEIFSISVSTTMTQPTRELQDQEVEKLKKWIDVAERLGAGHIRVFGGRVPKEATIEQASGWVVEVMKRGCDYSGKRGIFLGLENHGGITEKADTMIDIVKRVGSPWAGINVDTGNFNADPYEQLAKCMPYAVAVQVKTMIAGSGTERRREPSDWDRIAGMLVKAGYRGYLALEYEDKEPAPTAMPRLLKKLDDICRKHSA
jgi:sugar phosphate isomerase/epimerase